MPFIYLGAKHMVTGYDHLLFLVGDLGVRIGDVRLRPALALGSWVAFLDAGNGTAMAMGDLRLAEDEVNEVISTLQAGGVEQSALHNHVLGESPRVMHFHFGGHGDAVALARTLRAALERTKTPLQPSSGTTPSPDLPVAEMDRIFGINSKPNGGVLQYSVPRAERIVEQGMEIPPAAGMATAINFQATGNGRAATTGDFVLRATEVNPVIRELRAAGIAVGIMPVAARASPRRIRDEEFASGSAIYRLRTPPRGDCNGDGVVNGADVDALTAELADGVFQPLTNAHNGGHRGSFGCDADGDQLLTAADAAELSRILSWRRRAARSGG